MEPIYIGDLVPSIASCKKIIKLHYGFHQKEQDINTNGCNCSFIICIRKSRHNTPLN